MSSTPADAGRAFRPRFWPTLAALAGLVVLLSLGTWQLQRMAWKHDLIAHARRSWRRRRSRCRRTACPGWIFAGSLHTAPISTTPPSPSASPPRAAVPGGRLITPLRLDDGRIILVDRGWLPEDLLPPAVPTGLQPGGTVALEGVARWRGDATRGWMTPDDTPTQRRWYGWDIPAMARPLAWRSSLWYSCWSAPRGRPACRRRSRSRSISPTTI